MHLTPPHISASRDGLILYLDRVNQSRPRVHMPLLLSKAQEEEEEDEEEKPCTMQPHPAQSYKAPRRKGSRKAPTGECTLWCLIS